MEYKIELEQAVAILGNSTAAPTQTEEVSLHEALHRYLAGDITALTSIPPFARSPYDGYALRSADTQGASKARPAVLQVAGQVYAGDSSAALAPGAAVQVSTGAMLPQNADCVVKQEDTTLHGPALHVYTPLQPGQNYIAPGEDVQQGAPLLQRGTRLDAAALAVLALQGLASIQVYKKPAVTLLTSGDELLPPGAPPEPGKIYNGNHALLSARLQSLGAQVTHHWCGDNASALTQTIRTALGQTPLLISTGGVSVGEKDYLPAIAEALGCEILFHGVAIKPGSPAMAARLGGSLWLALSGNPFAAAATFEVLASPVVQRLAGSNMPGLQRVQGRLTIPFGRGGGPRRLVRAHIAGGAVTIPAQGHQSGSLLSLVGCNCLVDIPAGSQPLNADEQVEVYLLP